MYITPQSNFKLLKGVPFNSDLKHTILFSSLDNQVNYFLSKVKASFTQFTYVRQSNTVKVPMLADSLYDVNYCMFKNDAYGNKWFYGFVTNVEYVNDNTSEITFVIDYFQTWWFNVDGTRNLSVGKCFVLREHVDDDTIGKHTVTEPVEIGENVVQNVANLYFGNGEDIADNTWKVRITVNPSLLSGLTGRYTTQKQGNQLVATQDSFDMGGDITVFNRWLNEQAELGNEATSMVMYPKFFETLYGSGTSYYPMAKGITRPTEYYQPYMREERYTPTNNKLFTYPYTYMKVSNNQGQEVDYKWENMADGTLTFYVRHYVGNGVACELRPVSYESLDNRLYTIGINNFPEVSFLQNTSITNIFKMLTGVVGGVASAFTYSQSSSTRSGSGTSKSEGENLSSTTNYPLVKGKKAKHTALTRYSSKQQTDSSSASETTSSGFNPLQLVDTPLDLLGTLGNSSTRVNTASQGNLDIRWETYGFSFYQMAIKPEYAKLIDEYFTRFGYEIDEYKVPNLTSRSTFNFVKTVDCNVTGDAPNEALEVVSSMFDSGLTLWHTTDVGNYALANNINN